jgi:hypothetical protein
MKVLLDHCVDWRLKRSLPSHDVKSAQEMGWDELKNGKLLIAAASVFFDLMITVDQHIKDQQNLAYLPVAVIVLVANSNRLNDLRPLVPSVEGAMSTIKPGQLVEIDAAGIARLVIPKT